MNKKEYNQPSIEILSIKQDSILAGSLQVKSGSTNEQNAKSVNMSFEFDDDNEEDY